MSTAKDTRVLARWVGPFPARAPGVGRDVELVPGETEVLIGRDQAHDSDHWEVVKNAGKERRDAAPELTPSPDLAQELAAVPETPPITASEPEPAAEVTP